MKRLTVLSLLLLFACSKTDNQILEQAEFKDLIGTWINVYDGDDERKVIVHENGKVEIFKSIERGERFYIHDFYYDSDFKYIVEGTDTLRNRTLMYKKNGKIAGGITFYKKVTSDSARINIYHDSNIKDFIVDTSHTEVPKNLFIKNSK